ncbi:DUF1194 domain-containing protein [Aquicoccus sp. SCR17]|nr:DUF1194 domain-containing protein [Carideicomes alvinocaridis]
MRALGLLLCLLAAASPLRAQETREAPTEVDVELFIAVDVSRSMEPFELEIQRRGYAEALTSDAVLSAVANGLLGRIAITYVEWAGADSQSVVVPWTLLRSRQDAERVAGRIGARFAPSMRRTSISAVLLSAARSIEANDFAGMRRVIDVSGDGPNNMGPPIEAARDEVLAAGIVINGIPLMTRDEFSTRWSIDDLDLYYRDCVIGGAGAFVMPVTDWQAFSDTVRRKLVLEIAGLAPPARVIRAQAEEPEPYNCLVGEELWDSNRYIYREP